MQGRFPIRVELNNLTEADFVRILKEPDNAVLKQYKALLGVDGVELNFAEEVELTASVEECVVDVREFACFAEAISGFGIFFFFVLQEKEQVSDNVLHS